MCVLFVYRLVDKLTGKEVKILFDKSKVLIFLMGTWKSVKRNENNRYTYLNNWSYRILIEKFK